MKIKIGTYEYDVKNYNNTINYYTVNGKEIKNVSLRATLVDSTIDILDLDKLKEFSEKILILDTGRVIDFSNYELSGIQKNVGETEKLELIFKPISEQYETSEEESLMQ